MAIQELNQVEIEVVSGGLANTVLGALPIVGPIVTFLFKGEGELLGGELITNPLGVVTDTLNGVLGLVGGLLGGVLAIVTGLLR
jgi:hypothetical protein